jgi:hypothetical protein
MQREGVLLSVLREAEAHANCTELFLARRWAQFDHEQFFCNPCNTGKGHQLGDPHRPRVGHARHRFLRIADAAVA